MNKIIKGSIAGAAGIALLTGGYGTFALWSDTEDLPAGTVTSGKLHIVDAVDTEAWVYVDADGAVLGAFTPATDTLVPGDTVRLTQNLDVEATGNHLKASLTLTGLTESYANLVVKLEYAGKTATSAADGSGPVQISYANTDLPALNTATQAVVTFTLPSTVTGTTDQGSTATLADAALVLAQVS